MLSNLTKFVAEEGFGDSTWTIDLCYILRRFNVLFRYTTITIGVDPGYSKEAFYDKVLAKDNARVNDRFNDASENGMVILEKSVTLDEILEHLEKTGPVIILTNANLLTCSQCSNYSSCYQFCFSASVSYQEPLICVRIPIKSRKGPLTVQFFKKILVSRTWVCLSGFRSDRVWEEI